MIKLKRFQDRFIPNMDTVMDWDLGNYPINITPCPSGEVVDGKSFLVKPDKSFSYGTYVNMGLPWTSNDKSIVIIDQTFFSRHNIKVAHYFPTVIVTYNYKCVEAIARPSHLRLLSPDCKREGETIDICIDTYLYGVTKFPVLQSRCITIEEDILLVPTHLWDFFQTGKAIWKG